MMFVTRNRVNYSLPPEEKRVISSLLLDPWQRIYVQSGRISERDLAEPSIYSLRTIVVETIARLMILLTSEELDDRTELFRVVVTENEDELQRLLFGWRPPIEELFEVPADLEIGSFLGVKNEVSLVRFDEVLGEGVDRIHTTTESGLLISNASGRLLLYPNIELPLDFCVTTDAEKIDDILDAKAPIFVL